MTLGFRAVLALVAYTTSTISEMLYEGGLGCDSNSSSLPMGYRVRGVHIHDPFRSLSLTAGTAPSSGLLGEKDTEIVLLAGSDGSVVLGRCGFGREAGGKGVSMAMFWKASSRIPCMF